MDLKKHRRIFNYLVWIPAGALIMAFFAQIHFYVPWNDSLIQVTGQSFAVLGVALLLGRWIGVGASLLYLVLGVTGVPVFAGEGSGLSVLTGSQGGFMYSYPLAAWYVGRHGELEWNRNIPFSIISLSLGTLVILFFGTVHLSFSQGFVPALRNGLMPALPGYIIKIAAGGIAVPVIMKIHDLLFR
ncbi:MAG: biotin transporter BioY [Bacteroidales bacterium]